MLCRTSLRNPLSLIGFARIVPYFPRKRGCSPVFCSPCSLLPPLHPSRESGYGIFKSPTTRFKYFRASSTSRRSSAKLVSSSRVRISHARGTFDRKIAFSETSIKNKRTFETRVVHAYIAICGRIASKEYSRPEYRVSFQLFDRSDDLEWFI